MNRLLMWTVWWTGVAVVAIAASMFTIAELSQPDCIDALLAVASFERPNERAPSEASNVLVECKATRTRLVTLDGVALGIGVGGLAVIAVALLIRRRIARRALSG